MTYSEFRNRFTDVKEFRRAYGALTYEEAKALIDAETSPTHIKARMIDTWKTARLEVRLQNIDIRLHADRGLSIVFHEDDSDFDGNDFEYTYSLDAENTAAFIRMIPRIWSDPEINIQEWLVENIACEGIGGDLKDEWIRTGLHGKCTVWEDYPGGIYREESF